jgi:hypothetical protein
MRLFHLAIGAAVLLGAGRARAFTADELIARNIEARGGLEKLKAIRTIRAEGTRRGGGGGGGGGGRGGGSEMAYLQITTRSGGLRSEASTQGLTQVRAYDGKEGWTVQPFRGRREPEKLSADAVKEMAYDADIDGPLVDYKAKGNKVEYLGIEDVDGTGAHKLKVTRASGDVDFVFLDPDYFLEIRRLSQHRLRGAEVETETDYGEYEKVQGVFLPFSIETGAKGSKEKLQSLAISRIEVNTPVDDAIFRFPGAVPASPK